MDLIKKLDNVADLSVLREFSFSRRAAKLILKFEKYFGRDPTNHDFYNIYLKYSECASIFGKLFCSSGRIYMKAYSKYLNCPKLSFAQFKLLENYLVYEGIIKKEEK